jgi:hypothetical protein
MNKIRNELFLYKIIFIIYQKKNDIVTILGIINAGGF